MKTAEPVTGEGTPLAVTLTSGNRNDVTPVHPLLQAAPAPAKQRKPPRRRPDIVLGDRGHDHDEYRR